MPWPDTDSQVSTRHVAVDGGRVRVVDSGPPTGFPIVLLHGWAASAYNYRGVLPALGGQGFRAIAPDMPGHGSSDTTLRPEAWTSDSITRWVATLLDTLGVERCVVVGQSVGGAVALDAFARFADRILGAVLLAPIGFTPVRRVALARAVRWWHPSTTPRRIVAWVVRGIYGVRGAWTQRDVDEYWFPLQRSDVVGAILQSVREFDFVPRDPSSVVTGGRPLVIRFGELDGLIPAAAAVKHATQFTGADVAVLPGVGHVPADEIPDEIADLISRTATRVT